MAQRKFSIFRFTLQVVLQYVVMLLACRLLFPGFWSRQIGAGWVALVGVFLAMHFFICFFEWGFHRYVLHAVTSPLLTWFARGHRHHHSLTSITLRPVTEGSDRYVLNRYPITEESQYADSAFPVYATAAFWVLFSPMLIGFQFLLPTLPILLGGYTAITWSMLLYEILHAIEHQPYEWWKRATEHPRLGVFWSRLYGFHHMHHVNILCNEAISGFFGLPIADWLLGTYHQPKDLLLEGRVATARDFAIPAAPPLVKWMDAWARRRESRLRRAK